MLIFLLPNVGGYSLNAGCCAHPRLIASLDIAEAYTPTRANNATDIPIRGMIY